MAQLHTFETLEAAERRRVVLGRLGWRPFGIFRTSGGGWAFWTR